MVPPALEWSPESIMGNFPSFSNRAQLRQCAHTFLIHCECAWRSGFRYSKQSSIIVRYVDAAVVFKKLLRKSRAAILTASTPRLAPRVPAPTSLFTSISRICLRLFFITKLLVLSHCQQFDSQIAVKQSAAKLN